MKYELFHKISNGRFHLFFFISVFSSDFCSVVFRLRSSRYFKSLSIRSGGVDDKSSKSFVFEIFEIGNDC